MSDLPLTHAELGYRLMNAVIELAPADNPVAYCYVGTDGYVWCSFRQHGTDRVAGPSAESKARTALEWGKDTDELGAIDHANARATGVKLINRPGGLYIESQDAAIGISSCSGQGDDELAVKALAQVLDADE